MDRGLIFPSERGIYRTPGTVKRTLTKICGAATITKKVSPKWMRHTYNNLMRQAKVDRIVLRATTGHSAEDMTEHYSHVSMEEKKEAAARVLEMVGMG